MWLTSVAATARSRFRPRRSTSGTVHALDIEPDMVSVTQAKAEALGLQNVRACLRDFVTEGTGLPDRSVDYAMLFNILHAEQPETLLREAWRVIAPGGKLAVMHWNYDPTTPRGPSMDIRPRGDDCRRWAERVRISAGRIGRPAAISLGNGPYSTLN